MFTLLFLTACTVYVLLDLWLVHGLRALRSQAPTPLHPKTEDDDKPLVTVLIAARDEEDNLPRTLNALLAQDWPASRTQIVVVDDRSVDNTPEVLRDYAARFPGIDVVTVEVLPPGLSPKKHALMRGLEVARGSWIAVTDADCVMGPAWLSGLAREFADDVGMVLGLTAYHEPVKGFTPASGARALEFVSYGINAAGLVGLGFPVIANANNLAYRRRAFDEAGGFARHGDVVSGDDDFTLQEIHATGQWAIRYCTAPATLMHTKAPDTWGQFWEQRKRWAGKCLHYRPRQVAFLGLIFAFYLAIALLILAGLFCIGDGTLGLLGLIGFTVKTAADFAVMREGLKIFGLSPLLRFFPFSGAMHIPLVLGAVAAGSLGRFTWKGQRLARRA
jgi:cellulose synthase/poly-beta-1,6-N-acetylglucosamine synthase-like glycosyltransferase